MRKQLLGAAALWCVTAGAAAAAGDQCRDIAQDAGRLACYDAAFGAPDSAIKGGRPSVADSGMGVKWERREEKNPVTDEVTVISALTGEVHGGGELGPVLLGLVCQARQPFVTLRTGAYTPSASATVVWRLDDGEQNIEMWDVVSPDGLLARTSRQKAYRFMEDIKAGSRLGILVDTNRPLTVTFDISGISAEIDRVREACDR